MALVLHVSIGKRQELHLQVHLQVIYMLYSFKSKHQNKKNMVSTSLVCLPSWPHNEKDSIGTPHSLEHQMLWLCSSMWDRPISSCRKWPGKIYWAVCPSLSLQDQVRKQISWSLASLRLQHITTLINTPATVLSNNLNESVKTATSQDDWLAWLSSAQRPKLQICFKFGHDLFKHDHDLDVKSSSWTIVKS